VFFTLFPLSLIWARSLTGLAFAFVIRGLKEFAEPARKALIISLSPASNRGQTIGAYYLVRDLTVTAGSFLGAALWALSPEANFWSAFAVGVAGTLIIVHRGRGLQYDAPGSRGRCTAVAIPGLAANRRRDLRQRRGDRSIRPAGALG
jgi:hypothetical protein